jgi:hypothetical protein
MSFQTPQAVATPIRFDMSQVSRVEAEPNNDHLKAADVVPGEYAVGRIGTKGDIDFSRLNWRAKRLGPSAPASSRWMHPRVEPSSCSTMEAEPSRAPTGVNFPGWTFPDSKLSTNDTRSTMSPYQTAADADTEVPAVLHIALVK